MSKRFTETAKWTDRWFRRLSPNEKLLFLWLVDNCDNAGFWEVDLDLAAEQTGISKRAISGAYQGLNRAYLEHEGFIWIIRFVKVQGNWPLNAENNAHKQILAIFNDRSNWGVDFIQVGAGWKNDSTEKRGSLGASQPPRYSNSKGNVKVLVEKGGVGENIAKVLFSEVVLLTPDEHAKLVTAFGEQGAADRIEALNNGIKSKGYKYKSHYHTILTWERLNEKRRLNAAGDKAKQKSAAELMAEYEAKDAQRRSTEIH